MKKMNKKGFTIVELAIVVAVIAILAAVMIPTFGGITKSAKEAARDMEAKNIYNQYLYDNANTDAGAVENLYVKVVQDNNTYYYAVVEGVLNLNEGTDAPAAGAVVIPAE